MSDTVETAAAPAPKKRAQTRGTVSWETLTSLAEKLVDQGKSVTQIHRTGAVPVNVWYHPNGTTAAVFQHSDRGDCLVLGDGNVVEA